MSGHFWPRRTRAGLCCGLLLARAPAEAPRAHPGSVAGLPSTTAAIAAGRAPGHAAGLERPLASPRQLPPRVLTHLGSCGPAAPTDTVEDHSRVHSRDRMPPTRGDRPSCGERPPKDERLGRSLGLALTPRSGMKITMSGIALESRIRMQYMPIQPHVTQVARARHLRLAARVSAGPRALLQAALDLPAQGGRIEGQGGHLRAGRALLELRADGAVRRRGGGGGGHAHAARG
eukprot:CAMPEP_0203858728 /NCGR_PEP_ID=MMETSP0359-20131031/11445_1 /ASSEMBLY_ACC=CAM_ASM_000338 /TAXON_ID=268821 /ORGANISM="Scrippsiella Hangoei, Strain SHTV-5" /LENGTH=231 /DNA_ID=CAMNT_0050775547 /DNA_START=53 /DNA_END=744 /DNA_ORIENTATION=-